MAIERSAVVATNIDEFDVTEDATVCRSLSVGVKMKSRNHNCWQRQ
jgi:hypothetical protein